MNSETEAVTKENIAEILEKGLRELSFEFRHHDYFYTRVASILMGILNKLKENDLKK